MSELDILDNLFGAPTPLRLPLPDDTRAALLAQDIEPPEFVLLLLRQATPREVQQLAAMQMSPPNSGPEAAHWMVQLLMRRAAPGTDERVVREVVNDMTPSAMTTFTFAYTEGRLPDPKEREALAANLKRLLLTARPPEPAPSSPTSTASTSSSSRTSRRSTSRT